MYGGTILFAAGRGKSVIRGMSIPITLQLDLDTYHRFHSAHARLAEFLSFEPSTEWLLAFALSQTDADEAVRTLRQMGSDYLRNRRSLD